MIHLSFGVKTKNFLKLLIPPSVISLIRPSEKRGKAVEIWSGDYSSLADAIKRCTGYDNKVILENCKNALLQVKNNKAVYERG